MLFSQAVFNPVYLKFYFSSVWSWVFWRNVSLVEIFKQIQWCNAWIIQQTAETETCECVAVERLCVHQSLAKLMFYNAIRYMFLHNEVESLTISLANMDTLATVYKHDYTYCKVYVCAH